MADFLASFNFATSDDFAAEDGACTSVNDLQRRIRELMDAKTTDTRAEHVSTTINIAGTVEFTVSLTQADKDGIENVDPMLTAEAVTEVVTEERNQSQAHVYKVADALRDQPNQAPVAQQVVAEQVAMAIGVEDKSTWVLHNSQLAPHGWDFQFVCEGSVQHWKSQNGAKIRAVVVGEYTKKDPDPVLISRPAFDCRGRLFVSFSRKARTLFVKYNHTVMHKTVAELTELFKPPPMIGPQKPDKETRARAAKLAQDEAAKVRRKQNREKKKAQDGKPKRPSKKKNTKRAEQTEAQLLLADQAAQALDHAGISQLGQAVAAMENDQNGDGSDTGLAQNQPPSATKPLSLNAGVSPDSLSTDQFNIFANQAPDLQKDSLNMLITYGAERLQIIHPSNKESSTPVPQTEAAASGEGADSAARTTRTELVLEDSTPKGKRKGNPRPLGKSRLACFQCKSRKVKKPRIRKRKPVTFATDDVDAEADGNADAEADAEDDQVMGEANETALTEANDDDISMRGGNADQVNQETNQNDDDFDSDPGAPYSYPQVPGPELARDSGHDPIHGFHQQPAQLPYFQSASGLALPQPDPLDDASASQLDSADEDEKEDEVHVVVDGVDEGEDLEGGVVDGGVDLDEEDGRVLGGDLEGLDEGVEEDGAGRRCVRSSTLQK
ncbi:ATP-dependent DNA helicase II subunit 1 [Metarhizium rileyi]|uniref:ATP-dependent DNA helicase II subunit 1 n=1 Tax=Metarhizium rileyi (strain RCEF 4871) TaxID=1649241 RepID=A0A5C6GF58_METRR|nr:ATP-dependent DNA helicase II subunit 1 [Metarhizium rileyi]